MTQLWVSVLNEYPNIYHGSVDRCAPQKWSNCFVNQLLRTNTNSLSSPHPDMQTLNTPVKSQHTVVIYELPRLASSCVYRNLIYGHQHSSFNAGWSHASYWHAVSSLLLMEFGVTDLSKRLTRRGSAGGGGGVCWADIYKRGRSTLPMSSKPSLQ